MIKNGTGKRLSATTVFALLLFAAGCQVQLDESTEETADNTQGSSESTSGSSSGSSDSSGNDDSGDGDSGDNGSGEGDSGSGGADEGETQTATLSWSRPYERVNGESLEHFEIGGYEIRYRRADEQEYSSVIIEGSSTQSHVIDDLPAGDYTFQIAAFDTDGLYSQFVTADN